MAKEPRCRASRTPPFGGALRVVTQIGDDKLWQLVLQELEDQGFTVAQDGISLDPDADKACLRRIHDKAVSHRREVGRVALEKHQSELISKVANGRELDLTRISPSLKLVQSGSFDELLFRFCALHWSIPVSSGYGRRLRFIMFDDSNDKVIGIIGLADPVFSLANRDSWINWSQQDRNERLRHVMDAFVVGAIPPYSTLLCGKLVAMALASLELSVAFHDKYSGTSARISAKSFDGRLALITTASALGRSSVYNRLSFQRQPLFHHLGFTRGYGEFHFLNGTYDQIRTYVNKHGTPSRRHVNWGKGFRNRSEVIREFLKLSGKSSKFRQHTIKRELFAVPLASNYREFLQGKDSALDQYSISLSSLSNYFIERWLLPRSHRLEQIRDWKREEYKLW